MLRVRPYRPADRDACLAIFDSDCPRFLHPEERPGFAAWLDSLQGTYLVIEEDGGVIGCGGYALEEDGVTLTLTWGLLHADHHGRRLGDLLLLERLARALDECDATHSKLGTTELIEPFFERVGYRRVSKTPDGWGPGLDRVDLRLEFTPETAADLRRRRAAVRERHGLDRQGAGS